MTPQALQEYFHRHIPLSKAMGIVVESATAQGVRLAAPLSPNTNHHGTVFGGSASAAAILAAWGLLHVSLAELDIAASIVIQKNVMNYGLPITGEFTAEAAPPAPEKWQRFLDTLSKHRRARIAIRSVLNCNGQDVGELEGDFVAILA